jgi:hypothetical protein
MFNHDVAKKDGFVLHYGYKLEYVGFDANGNVVVKKEDGVISVFSKDVCKNLPKEKNTLRFVDCLGNEVKTGDKIVGGYGLSHDIIGEVEINYDGLKILRPDLTKIQYSTPLAFKLTAWVKKPIIRSDWLKCINAAYDDTEEEENKYDDLVSIALSPRDWSVIKYITTLVEERYTSDDGPLAAPSWLYEKLTEAGVPDINYDPKDDEDGILIRTTWPKEALELEE